MQWCALNADECRPAPAKRDAERIAVNLAEARRLLPLVRGWLAETYKIYSDPAMAPHLARLGAYRTFEGWMRDDVESAVRSTEKILSQIP